MHLNSQHSYMRWGRDRRVAQKLLGQLALSMAETKRETVPQHKVERENQLLQIVLQPPHMCCGTLVPPPCSTPNKNKGFDISPGIQLAITHVKRCSKSLILNEMDVKSPKSYCCTPMTPVRMWGNSKVCALFVDYKMISLLWKLEFPKNKQIIKQTKTHCIIQKIHTWNFPLKN